MTERPGGSGSDPISEFQQWLIRSGAREVGRGLRDRFLGTLGLGAQKADVWESATSTPAGEAPECAWCPLCRAARLLREQGPGVGSQVAAAGEALASVVQEAASAVEAALAAARRASAGEGQARSAWSPGADDVHAGGVWEGGAGDGHGRSAGEGHVGTPEDLHDRDAGEVRAVVTGDGHGGVGGRGAADVGIDAGIADEDARGEVPEDDAVGKDGAAGGQAVTRQEEHGQQARDEGDEPGATEPPKGPPHEPDDRG